MKEAPEYCGCEWTPTPKKGFTGRSYCGMHIEGNPAAKILNTHKTWDGGPVMRRKISGYSERQLHNLYLLMGGSL